MLKQIVMFNRRIINKILRRTMVGGLALFLAACASVQTTSSGVVGIDRKQYMSGLVSGESLSLEASQQYSSLMSQARAQGALDNNPAQTKRVQTIARNLINHVSAFRPDASSWKWEVHLLDSNEVNAWCMPGGKMAVYTGLINAIKPTDDELAAVIGHEIAHALREHSREQVSQQMAAGIGLSVLAAITGSSATADLGAQLNEVMFALPNSRSHEAEADRIGVELAARAGYDPRAALTLWKKMEALGGSRPPELLSTHPSPASRMSEISAAAERVMPIYKQAVKR